MRRKFKSTKRISIIQDFSGVDIEGNNEIQVLLTFSKGKW